MQTVRIKNGPPTKTEPARPVQMNIYQSNTYRKGFNWPHLAGKPSVQEKQQVLDQKSCTLVSVAYPSYASSS